MMRENDAMDGDECTAMEEDKDLKEEERGGVRNTEGKIFSTYPHI
jgi:hypothetical protein